MQKYNISRKSAVGGGRAWNFLRMALLWANRKGGVLMRIRMRRLMANLRLLPAAKFINKTILGTTHMNYYYRRRHHHHNHHIQYYGERELSFDNTPRAPVIHLRMHHRPSSSLRGLFNFIIPSCITASPRVDFDYYYDDQYDSVYRDDEDVDDVIATTTGHHDPDEREEERDDDDGYFGSDEQTNESSTPPRSSCGGDHEIDLKAEQFIANFYQQMKLQRQISRICNTYHEIIN